MNVWQENLQELCDVIKSAWSLRNVSSTLLNPCLEEFELFWRQKRVLT
uniref:Uncharacterized protein n=1 Tax=Anguilla anguilla TaxID=7936 RepID=A0A0E9V9M1_ANGAN